MGFTTFNDMLRKAAWRMPDHPYLYWSDRQRGLTYQQGVETSEAVAGALASLGVTKGDRVGIFAHNGIDYVNAMFGAWRLGAISAHINVLQAQNMAWFVNDSGPRVLIYTGDLQEIVERNRAEMKSIEHFICFDGAKPGALDWNELVAAKLAPPAVDVDSEDAAHLSYTSGSAGKPKGAVLAHGFTARATHCIAERLDLSADDVSLGPTSLASSYILVGNLLPGIHRCVDIGIRKKWDAQAVWDEMEQRGVTFMVANPLLLNDLLLTSRKMGRKPARLRFVVSGGAPTPPELKLAWQDELGAPLVESYGQSELGGFVALGYPRATTGSRLAAIGPEVPDREVRIADENDQEMPIGAPGEILIRGGVMVGYHNLPEKTAEVLRNGWLHTGDMGVMDNEGYIRLVGRWSERIFSHGKVIFPRPMEEGLLRHPAVQYSCVIAKPDKEAGQLPKAVVELYAGQTATPEELMQHCVQLLGKENSPALIEIIDQMPMTPTGKIGRADLQARENELGI